MLRPEQRDIAVRKGKGAMGQSHLCYSHDKDGKLRPWVVEVLQSIQYLESGGNRIAEEIDSNGRSAFTEGEVTRVLVNRYERDPLARRKCIAALGSRCKICEVDLGERYPGIGDNFIVVHHLFPVSKRGRSQLDPIKDLLPVCPNCHAMLHRRQPEPYTPDELRDALKRGRRQPNRIRRAP